MKFFPRLLFAIFTMLLCWLALSHAFAQLKLKSTPIVKNSTARFNGTLLVTSDADQIGTAYANGIINKVEGIEDSLTILQFDTNGNFSKSQLHVSNSVVSWPSIIAQSPDGKRVYVVETYGIYRGKSQRLQNLYAELPGGEQLTIVDVSHEQPVIVQQISIGKNPKTASVNARGDLFVTSSQEKGKELVLAVLENGLVKKVQTFAVKGLERAGTNEGVNFVAFHPTLDVIALIKDNRTVAFYKIMRTGADLIIEPTGELHNLGKVLSVGNFTPDGKFFLVTDVGWGDSQLGNVFNGKGHLISIRFDDQGKSALVNKAKVGLSPEGFDVSPDGQWAVVVNMRRTYLPEGLPFSLFAARKRSSLSLIKINPETGALQTMGEEYGFEGELPEDAVFDLDSQNIVVTIYNQRFEAFPKQGYLEFWQLQSNKLVRTATKIPVTRGPHCLKLLY
jgi:DNA-binding beta-propeller fold protein YncE